MTDKQALRAAELVSRYCCERNLNSDNDGDNPCRSCIFHLDYPMRECAIGLPIGWRMKAVKERYDNERKHAPTHGKARR